MGSNGHSSNDGKTPALEKHPAHSAVYNWVINYEKMGDASWIETTRSWFCILEYEGQHFQSTVCTEVTMYFVT